MRACVCVCVCVCVIWAIRVLHQTDGPPAQYSVRWPLGNLVNLCATPPLTITHTTHTYMHTTTHSLSFPLSLSLSLSLSLYSTTGRADGSPSARRARKSMWIKGYTQQVWRAASTVAVRQRGAPAHLPPRLGDIWLGFCGMMSAPPPTTTTATAAGTTPKGEAVICSFFQLANERVSVCLLLVCVCICVCVCVCVCVCRGSIIVSYWRIEWGADDVGAVDHSFFFFVVFFFSFVSFNKSLKHTCQTHSLHEKLNFLVDVYFKPPDLSNQCLAKSWLGSPGTIKRLPGQAFCRHWLKQTCQWWRLNNTACLKSALNSFPICFPLFALAASGVKR